MGTVWLARLVGKYGFEKLFAVKTIRSDYAAMPAFRAMFLDEARVASRIHHDNVVEVVELGEDRDLLFMVMNWVDGESLSKYAQHHSVLPLSVALRIASDASRGLGAAHVACDAQGEPLGIVHRDVSPQNILVTAQGTAKVIDFGIAKARDRFAAESSHGTIKGKLRYMAPEQVRGDPVTPATDVYALGAVLYQLLCGRPPRDGENDAVVMNRVLHGAPIEPLPPRVPAPIARVVETALAHEVAARWSTMDALRVALEEAAAQSGVAIADPDDVVAFAARHLAAEAHARADMMNRARFVSEGESADTKKLPPTALGIAGATDAAPTSVAYASETRGEAPTKARRPAPSIPLLISGLVVTALGAGFAVRYRDDAARAGAPVLSTTSPPHITAFDPRTVPACRDAFEACATSANPDARTFAAEMWRNVTTLAQRRGDVSDDAALIANLRVVCEGYARTAPATCAARNPITNAAASSSAVAARPPSAGRQPLTTGSIPSALATASAAPTSTARPHGYQPPAGPD